MGNVLSDARIRRIWFLLVAVPASTQLGLSAFAGQRGIAESASFLFWGVLVAASLCVVSSLALIGRAWVTGEAELGFTGAFFLATSVLPLAHGVTTPGVVFEANGTTMVSILISIPVGLLCALPMLSRWFRRVVVPGERWRPWVAASSVASTLLAIVLVALSNTMFVPDPESVGVRALAGASFVGCVVLSFRHLQLALIAMRGGPLVVAAGYAMVGSSAFVWFGSAPYSAGFWIAHLLDITGVFLATVAGVMVYRRTDHVREVISSVLAVDPLGALEIGLDPVVHEFVADLETKDRITRDHVVRTAELAVQVGSELGLSPEELRDLGLAAILHDVGKLAIPDEVLQKPGKLTDDEYQIIKTHAAEGAKMLSNSTVLAGIAPAVRAHHERVDGNGYPDGLAGEEIPPLALIVSVCDAYDAMANTRQYRVGMGREKAVSILREHAGSQWDTDKVEALARVVASVPPSSVHSLDGVGRVGCDCLPENELVGGLLGELA